VVRWLVPPPLPPRPAEPGPPSIPCGIEPLPAVADAEALKFEAGDSTDVKGLMPAMARALEKFKQLVNSVGGSFELKSAYRPPAYQAHLQQVWYKWKELRNNHDLGCQVLRAQVGDEFAKHHLLETQKPVTDSDHTRGLAFDATVLVPPKAVLKKRRVSLDRLALLAGIKRPDILHDPVHFKLSLATLRVATPRRTRHA
jgi:D-alanyl-D-alanine dipeptidase